MDYFTPDITGKIFAIWLKVGLSPGRRLAMVATADIRWLAAQGFLHPESEVYKNRALSLAGDELSFEDVDGVFRERLGYGVPNTWELVRRFILWMVVDLGIMSRWFDEVGYKPDIGGWKELNPGLLTLGDWLEKHSGFPMKK